MTCPICRKPVDSETDLEFPFCSERCRLLDLGNWSSEKYVVSESALDETLFEQLEREIKPDDESKN
ncbi:MAG TPA: DNA gyrase inhibitor YacG [Verrucomicrobiae bacterium]|nr:DNA gyrase inhibitor YacG [Verrucomicrobiae bacterium]